MTTPTEAERMAALPEFLKRKAQQAIDAATNPQGMHTNGPAYARIEASHLANLLRYAEAGAALEKENAELREKLRHAEEYIRGTQHAAFKTIIEGQP